MKQSRAMSLIEATINIAIGFGISLAAQWFFLPLLGVVIDFKQNLFFALIMTVVSIARQFILRRVFEALHIRRPLSPAMQAIIAERLRQIDVEGYSTAHDDNAHRRGDLAQAGACYALLHGSCELINAETGDVTPFSPYALWPWDAEYWKPQTFRRDLVRAGALVVAEIDRLDRARKPKRADRRESWGIRKGGINPTPTHVPRPDPLPFRIHPNDLQHSFAHGKRASEQGGSSA